MPPKLLIVDDEAYIRLLIGQALEDFEDQGVQILTASDGQEALDTIRVEKPALVFLDVMMPKLNGFDVCAAVKADPQLKSTCIVLITAKGQEEDRLRGDEVGADMFMTKPFDPDELTGMVASILEL